MAVTVPNQAIILAIADGRQFEQQVMLTHHYRLIIEDGSPPDMYALIQALHGSLDAADSLWEAYTACLHISMVEIRYLYQVIYPTRYIQVEEASENTIGVVEGDPLPQNVATAITLRSDGAGPANRGTKHIGGVPADAIFGGRVTIVGNNRLAELGIELALPRTLAVGGGNQTLIPTIYHRANPVLSPSITNHIIGTTSRVERRRTVGRGS